MSDWQPIETAPKDGTYIIVARRGEDIGSAPMEITQFFEIKNYHYEQVEGDIYRKVEDEPYRSWNGNGHRATHWMPLPDPPK